MRDCVPAETEESTSHILINIFFTEIDYSFLWKENPAIKFEGKSYKSSTLLRCRYLKRAGEVMLKDREGTGKTHTHIQAKGNWNFVTSKSLITLEEVDMCFKRKMCLEWSSARWEVWLKSLPFLHYIFPQAVFHVTQNSDYETYNTLWPLKWMNR